MHGAYCILTFCVSFSVTEFHHYVSVIYRNTHKRYNKVLYKVLYTVINSPLSVQVYIDNPTEIEREEIFKIHMATVKIGDNLKESYAARLAACTPGMVFQDS